MTKDEGGPENPEEFRECDPCAAKSGTPPLCPSCLHNRRLISDLQRNARTLASAMDKFAPDLMAELMRRHQAATGALDNFLMFVRDREQG